MSSRPAGAGPGACAFCLLFALALAAPQSQAKFIRLRNETIETASPAVNAALAQANAPVSGLYLVQLRQAPTAEIRAQLAAAGVDLLHYVPEDTFLARLQNVPLGSLRALTFVQWVGSYRADDKIHDALRRQAQAKTLKPGEPIGITVLLVPRATAADILATRAQLTAVREQSNLRSGTVLRGTIMPSQLNALARSDVVVWLEPAPHFKLVDEVASKIVAGDGGTGTLLTQSLGYDGHGIRVAVADTGLNNGDAATMHPDLLGRTPAFFYYGTLVNAADEHSHGTHVAGIIAGNGATGETDANGALYGLGVAPGASIVAQRIFDAAGNFEGPVNGFPELTQDATSAGAVIGSNSWGDDVQGRYDVSAMQFDELVRDSSGTGTNNLPYILEFSAGNAGPGTQTMDSPGVAKNVLATGACENDRPDYFIYGDGPDAMADFSSRGPCEDGRIKPDLVAPGTWISSLQSASASDQFAWLPIDSLYQFQGGTSQAGPHASGAAAVFVQYYRQNHTNATPSPALVKAALINAATAMDPSFGNSPVPNMDEGWGRLDLVPLFDPALTFEFIDQPVFLTNAQIFEHRVLIADATNPLKVTLSYTDVPGFPGALPALVNDLDLEVISPDGTLYRGNQFTDGESIPNASVPDQINNVEGVQLSGPLPGEYIVRVRARNVVQDILGASGHPRQDFALVVSGVLPVPGVGALYLDRGSYTAPSRIKVTLIDTDQAGHASETVHVASLNEPAGENLVLNPAGSSGSFTGAIATATGPPIADGRLQITNNDSIQVTYFDASANATRIATARADLVPPVLSTPSATNSFAQEVISWSSDEPATSIVRYGTNRSLSSLNFAVTNSDLVTSHSISLGNLIANQTYYYYVVSSDEAGNTATNSAGGAFYSFVPPVTATLLLIDEYGTDPVSGTTPSLAGYTDALNAIGATYDVWDISSQGSANNLLAGYRGVIWRVPELQGAWSPSERFAISNYLATGGSLFVSSMQLMSRLELDANDPQYIRNVFQVDSYQPDDSNAPKGEQIIGSSNETIGNGINIAMDYSFYADMWTLFGTPIVDPPDISESMTPKATATPVLWNDLGEIVGLRWPAIGQRASGRLVFFSFPIDAAPIGNGVNDRINLFRNVIAFLTPGADGLATVSLDAPAYTLPSVVTVEVDDGNLAGSGSLSVTATTEFQPAGISVTLTETATRGQFLGSFNLVVSTNPPVAGRLRAQNGNTLRVSYFNAAANSYVTASAAVDTVPPVISNVAAQPDYLDATISWDTSELADSLVQFGESPLLGRTAYAANPVTSHSLDLPGLRSDTTYYYQVASRDLAGNTALEDNSGRLYTFHTLLPLTAPWSDNMDTGATNWTTYADPDSQTDWTLGVPNNGQETSAHSPPDAWGSNLGGAPIDAASTFLISAATILPAGAIATLHFWHSYDFTLNDQDIYENGQLLLITNNNSTTPITLASYDGDATAGWEPQTLDLSPYSGQLINLAWDYELFSFETRSRPGWLVDDVSITVSNPPPPFRLTITHLNNSVYRIAWPAYSGKKYMLLTTTNFSAWANYTNNWFTNNQFDVTIPPSSQRSFFRVQSAPLP